MDFTRDYVFFSALYYEGWSLGLTGHGPRNDKKKKQLDIAVMIF